MATFFPVKSVFVKVSMVGMVAVGGGVATCSGVMLYVRAMVGVLAVGGGVATCSGVTSVLPPQAWCLPLESWPWVRVWLPAQGSPPYRNSSSLPPHKCLRGLRFCRMSKGLRGIVYPLNSLRYYIFLLCQTLYYRSTVRLVIDRCNVNGFYRSPIHHWIQRIGINMILKVVVVSAPYCCPKKSLIRFCSYIIP